MSNEDGHSETYSCPNLLVKTQCGIIIYTINMKVVIIDILLHDFNFCKFTILKSNDGNSVLHKTTSLANSM